MSQIKEEKKDKKEKVQKKAKNPDSMDDYKFDEEMSGAISEAIAIKKEKAESMRKNKKTAIVTASVASTLGVLAAVYFGGWAASMGSFLPNTYINGVNVGKMNISEASAAIREGSVPEMIVVNERFGTKKEISPAQFDFKYEVFEEVQQMFENQSHAGWLSANFSNTYLQTQTKPTYDADKLTNLLNKTQWGSVETADAHLVHGDAGFYIEDEVEGDIPVLDTAVSFISDKIAEGQTLIDLNEADCYTDPQVRSGDLTQKLEELNRRFNFVINFDFSYTTEVLTGEQVYEWVDDNGQVIREKVDAYVAGLAAKYDTFMTPRKFNTTNRGTITLNQERYSAGQYGWWIDTEKTAEQIIRLIDEGQTVFVEPEYYTDQWGYVYRGFAPGRSAESDIGNTYIEIDLSAQHMWYYQNGVLAFETDQIVSGKANDKSRKTPEGVYCVFRKNTNYTMRTSTYTAYCNYFMRCSFDGIGLHDYSRPAYGGSIYLTNGSHGCINMKLAEVSKLYEMVELKTPVIMYY